jgi:hypothetical protein
MKNLDCENQCCRVSQWQEPDFRFLFASRSPILQRGRGVVKRGKNEQEKRRLPELPE